MKEYLDPNDNYKFHKIPVGDAPHWMIEIPDGAMELTKGVNDLVFWSNGYKASFNYSRRKYWSNCNGVESMTFDDYCLYNSGYKTLWRRQAVFIDESEIVNEEMKSLDEKVNQPSHYANFSIECIDAMQSMLSREEFVGYLRGNIFKYQWRYKLKNGVEDLKKAQWYQNKLIEVEENE
ncbi:nucleotide kinase [Acinetobacter phage XC1]|nr:nucleotide kinase [Acinetobacter phage XC1]